MAHWMGALLGAAIDRRDGDSGLKGMLIGGAAEATVRVLAPLAVTFAIGAAVQYGARAVWRRVTADGAEGDEAAARAEP